MKHVASIRLKAGTVVLRATGGEVQVGLAPGIVLSGLSETQMHALEMCETQAQISPSRQALLGDCLDRLKQGGLVDTSPASQGSIVVNDAGPVGLWIARVFANMAWTVTLDDNRAAASAPPGTYSPHESATRQAAAQATVMKESCADEDSVRLGHGPGQVAVLVNHGMPALDAAIPLMASDTPHVFVTTDESGITLGPLVAPGLGACGMCWELGRTRPRADVCAYAVQLLGRSRRLPFASPSHAATCAGLLASIVQHWATDGADLVNTVWRVEGPSVTVQSFAADPHCGCGAAGPMGDEVAARRAAFR